MKATALLIAIVLISGCATTPISSEQADPVPGDRQVRYRSPAPNTVPITITRDSGFISAACATKVFVNGELAAYVRAGERVTLNIPAGEVIIGAQPDGICAGGLVETQAILQPARHIQFRIGYDHNGSIGLYRTVAR